MADTFIIPTDIDSDNPHVERLKQVFEKLKPWLQLVMKLLSDPEKNSQKIKEAAEEIFLESRQFYHVLENIKGIFDYQPSSGIWADYQKVLQMAETLSKFFFVQVADAMFWDILPTFQNRFTATGGEEKREYSVIYSGLCDGRIMYEGYTGKEGAIMPRVENALLVLGNQGRIITLPPANIQIKHFCMYHGPELWSLPYSGAFGFIGPPYMTLSEAIKIQYLAQKELDRRTRTLSQNDYLHCHIYHVPSQKCLKIATEAVEVIEKQNDTYNIILKDSPSWLYSVSQNLLPELANTNPGDVVSLLGDLALAQQIGDNDNRRILLPISSFRVEAKPLSA